MIKTRGNLQVQALPKLTVSQLYPEERKEINLSKSSRSFGPPVLVRCSGAASQRRTLVRGAWTSACM